MKNLISADRRKKWNDVKLFLLVLPVLDVYKRQSFKISLIRFYRENISVLSGRPVWERVHWLI